MVFTSVELHEMFERNSRPNVPKINFNSFKCWLSWLSDARFVFFIDSYMFLGEKKKIFC